MKTNKELFVDRKLVKLPGDLKDCLTCSITANGKRIDGDLYLLSVVGEGASNVQVDHTFGGDILVSAFGEQLTVLRFSGIYAAGVCSGLTESDIMTFYKNYRAGTNPTTPEIVVTYGTNVFRGIMLGLTLDPYDPRTLNGYAYTFSILGSFT